MSIISDYNTAVFVDLLGNTSGQRNLKGANVYFIDSDTNITQEMDSISLSVEDSEGTLQYLLTTVSTPEIEFDDVADRYSVESIDVSNFPDGDITLTWEGILDGYAYTNQQTVAFNTAPDMIFVSGWTQTITDYKVILGQAKTFATKINDAIGNPITTGSVRAAILDTLAGGVVEYLAASLVSNGTGLWTVTSTLNSGTYTASLNRYELFWELNSAGLGYAEVLNSRVPLEVYNALANATTSGGTYSSNQSIRETFPDIDSMLSQLNDNSADRELILNRARYEASVVINEMFKDSRQSKNHKLLEILEIYSVYRAVLIKSHSFAKFALADGQIQLLDKEIKRIKNSLFGTISIRIGPRA